MQTNINAQRPEFQYNLCGVETTYWWSCGCCIRVALLPFITLVLLIVAASINVAEITYDLPDGTVGPGGKTYNELVFAANWRRVTWDNQEIENDDNLWHRDEIVKYCDLDANDDFKQLCNAGKAYLAFGITTVFLYFWIAFWHAYMIRGSRLKLVKQDCFDAMPSSSKIRIGLQTTPAIIWFFWSMCLVAMYVSLGNLYEGLIFRAAVGTIVQYPSLINAATTVKLDNTIWWLMFLILPLLMANITCCCCFWMEEYKDVIIHETGQRMSQTNVHHVGTPPTYGEVNVTGTNPQADPESGSLR